MRTAGSQRGDRMDGRIDLERARRDAKALLRAARAGEARLRADREPVLADAQRAIAQELGFPSWPAMVGAVAGERLLTAARDGRADDVHRRLMEGAPANYAGPEGRRCTWPRRTAGRTS